LSAPASSLSPLLLALVGDGLLPCHALVLGHGVSSITASGSSLLKTIAAWPGTA
jgi:hypothetical protein